MNIPYRKRSQKKHLFALEVDLLLRRVTIKIGDVTCHPVTAYQDELGSVHPSSLASPFRLPIAS